MAIKRFLLRREFREGLADPWKKEERIVAESATSARALQDNAIRCSAECCHRSSVSSRSERTHKSPGALLGRNIPQLSKHARVVRHIVSVRFGEMWLLRRIAGRMNSRRPAERIHLESGIVRDNKLSWCRQAVFFSFLAGILFKGGAVLHDRGKSCEAWNAGNHDAMNRRGPREVSQLAWVRGCHKNRACCQRVRSTFIDVLINNPAKMTMLTSESTPPAVRSGVRAKLIFTSFSPASTGTIISPVTSADSVATA